jgi:hypothetical protein
LTATVAILPEAEDVNVQFDPQRANHRRLPSVGPRRPVHHERDDVEVASAALRQVAFLDGEIAAVEQLIAAEASWSTNDAMRNAERELALQAHRAYRAHRLGLAGEEGGCGRDTGARISKAV